MICARYIFRCFKWLERLGDKVTGAAGPFFVGFAVLLLSTGTISFFDVIQPTLSLPLLTTPICSLIALNLIMHYYYACTVPPGFVEDPPREAEHGILWSKKNGPAKDRNLTGVQWSEEGSVKITKAMVTKCRKCGQLKPERTHHCRICNHCVLKYDHHCPVRINQCVGIHNERHFVMFMAYLVLSTFCFSILGYQQMFKALGVTFDSQSDWPYLMPQLPFILIYILSVVLCIAVSIMLSWHLWSICKGETSVEGQDHEVYRNVAKQRGDIFVNSYDLGKRKNLELFFNIGENGYPIYTLVLPLRISPYTDGRAWARRHGYERHRGIRHGEELTDEEDEEES
ncbi:hypothetical protein PILCRDRAFT_97949 [Piloderma croceum F 1598]|uniref:Palmitoyltransferase n=1 Tax=Piloderma croceum (strain F 1598) TaxID=765440 RepID=A0A0C3F6N8_PILCF|nr:hypothetical protein PILCRDRAFT_97949 [Piloderma croceum F 1598]